MLFPGKFLSDAIPNSYELRQTVDFKWLPVVMFWSKAVKKLCQLGGIVFVCWVPFCRSFQCLMIRIDIYCFISPSQNTTFQSPRLRQVNRFFSQNNLFWFHSSVCLYTEWARLYYHFILAVATIPVQHFLLVILFFTIEKCSSFFQQFHTVHFPVIVTTSGFFENAWHCFCITLYRNDKRFDSSNFCGDSTTSNAFFFLFLLIFRLFFLIFFIMLFPWTNFLLFSLHQLVPTVSAFFSSSSPFVNTIAVTGKFNFEHSFL